MTEIDEFLGIRHHFSSGVYAKEAHLAAGTFAVQHVHEFDHLSVLASGRVLVEVEGELPRELAGTHCLTIVAGKAHKITALEDSIWFCIHASDETDPKKVDDVILHREN